MPDFRTGGDAAQEAFDKIKSDWQRVHFLSMEDKEEAYMRFLTEIFGPEQFDVNGYGRIIVVNQHTSVPTKPKPAGREGNWPPAMPAVCRYDKAFAGEYTDCFIDDHKRQTNGKPYSTTPRVWAWACLREQVLATEAHVAEFAAKGQTIQLGQVLGYRDKERIVKRKKKDSEETEEIREKAIVLVNQGWKNFFGTLKGYAKVHGSILDRDYFVTRNGSDENTTYTIIPMPEIPGFDARDPEIFARYAKFGATWKDLSEQVAQRASDDYFQTFFDTRVETPASNGAAASPSGDVDQAALEEMRRRVLEAQGPVVETTAPPSAPATAPAEPTPAPVGQPVGMRSFE